MATNKAIAILMKRDGLTEKEAREAVEEAREWCIIEGCEDPITDLLGLEPDYLIDVLF